MIMKWILFFLLCATFESLQATYSEEYQLGPNEALEFLVRARRSFLHPGKSKCEEQKREARKGYEEKCTVLGKRFCPKLNTWRDFQQWEIGNGYESRRSPLPTTPPPQVYTMRTHHTRFYTPATLPTYRTPLYGSVTMRPDYRRSVYTNEDGSR